jgi:hypothetical protein
MSVGGVRAPGLEIEEVVDGYVAVDATRDRVHYLNHTAALILELCTGERGADEISSVLQRAYDLSAPPDEHVRECLSMLTAAGLVLETPA